MKKLTRFLKIHSHQLIILGMFLEFIGSILAFGALPSDEQIAQISGTYFGSNSFLKESLEKNRSFACLGLIFISTGFAMELAGVVSLNKDSKNL